MKRKRYLSGICILILLMTTVCTPILNVHAEVLTQKVTCSQEIGTSKSYSISTYMGSGWLLESSRWVLSGSGASITSSDKYGCTVEATGAGEVELTCIWSESKSYNVYDPLSGKWFPRKETHVNESIWYINIGNPITVSFNVGGGDMPPASKKIIATENAVYGELPTPTKSGYIFKGWTLDNVQITGYSRLLYLTNHTLYAQWEKIPSYTIKFSGNGSTSGTVDSMSCTYGYTYTLPKNSFHRDGYWFDGWNTESDGTGTTYKAGERVTNLATIDGWVIFLYAMWSDDPMADGDCGENISWKIDETGCLIISGSGSMPNAPWRSERQVYGWWNSRLFSEINKVVVEEGITRIGNNGLSRLSHVTEVELPDTLTSIGENAFDQCDSLQSIKIPDSVQTIGEYAFKDCTSLHSIELGTGISTIEESAFYRCCSLTDIHLPANVGTIGDFAFSRCDDLQRITVDADNPYYTVKDNVLYDKSMTEIVVYPSTREGDTYYIPDGITTLPTNVFSSAKFTTLVVPASVTSIGYLCFCDNTALKKIYFRGGPPELLIGKYDNESHAFGRVKCGIYYPKSKESSWQAVESIYKDAGSEGDKPNFSYWGPYSLSSSISNCTVTVDTSESLVYDGTEKKPEVRVSDSDAPLIEGTEYKIEYGNNICAGNDTDEGAPYVKVTGLGDYAGTSKIQPFTIKKASQRPEIEVSANKINKGETAVIKSAVGYGLFRYTSSDEKILTVDADGVITGVGDGTATVTAKASGDDNYDAGSATVSITVYGHEWDGGTVTKAATCTQAGERTFTCQNDKTHKRTETIAIDKNAHDYGSWEQCNEKQHKRVCRNDSTHIDYAGHKFVEKIDKAATALKDGSKHEECLTCGYKKQSVRIPATGVPKAGTSLRDAKTGNSYTVVDSGKRQVKYTGPVNKNVKQVSIPASVTVNGVTYTVTEIGKNAFSGCSKLKTVRMGANVITIGDKAFYKCKALTKVIIPAKVKKIGKQAFYGCKKLKTITIKTTRLTSKKVGSKAFKGIHAKATVKVPRKKLTSYKKILRAKGVGSKVKIKK